MKITNLKISILVPLILALILLLGSFVFISYRSQQKILERDLVKEAKGVENLFHEYGKHEVMKLSSTLKAITRDMKLLAAFKAKDRERIFKITKPLFEQLRSEHGITHFYFTGPDRVNILRVHQPGRFGDKINRFTTLEAERTGKESWGIEMGPLGTLTLRAVTPWYYRENLVGYVELGIEVEHFMEVMRKILSNKLYVFVSKDLVDREGWEAGMRMLGREGKWERFPDTVTIGEQMELVPDDVAKVMARKHTLHPVPSSDISIDGTHYQVIFIPLIDAGKREAGHISILHDTTAMFSAFHISIVSIGVICLIIGGALFAAFYVILGRIDRKLESSHSALIKESGALRESEEKFYKISASAKDAIIMMDNNGKISFWNKAAETIFGYAKEEALGKETHILLAPERYYEAYKKGFAKFRETGEGSFVGKTLELTALRKDGTEFPMEISVSAVKLKEKWSAIGVIRDITVRRKAEEEIQQSHDTQNVINSLLSLSLENVPLEDIMHRALDLILSIPWLIVQSRGSIFLAEDDHEILVMKAQNKLAEPIQKACAGVSFGRCLCGKAALTQKIEFADCLNERHEVSYEGIIPHGHYCVPILCAGRTLGVINVYLKEGHQRSQRDEEFLTAIANTLAGIIVRKRAEEEIRKLNEDLEMKVEERTKQLLEAQEELVRKEKLATLGQFVESVGHELRNPMGVINNAIYFLKTVLPDADETVKEYLNIIKKEVDNSQRIISDLLDSTRTKTPHAQLTAADELIKQTLGKRSIPENITVHIDIPETLPMINVDPLQMEQVFQNLIMNAVQAMPDGGELRISARQIADCGMHPPIPPLLRGGKGGVNTEIQNPQSEIGKSAIEISITDTGEGISPENMEKLFHPLFTTKARGIGLGLTVAKRLTEANAGKIEVESQMGKGATFKVILPVEK